MAWVSGAISAVGSIAGSVLGKGKKSKAKQRTITDSNPLMNGLSVETMLALGLPITPEMLQKASPIGRLSGSHLGRQLINLVNEGQAQGLSVDEIVSQIEGAKVGQDGRGWLSKQFGGEKKLEKILALSGYSSLHDLVSADLAFSSSAQERAGRLNAAQPAIEQGRIDALRKVAGIQSGFVAPSEADLLSRTGDIETSLRAQIARERADSENALLEQAQARGINPGARLGRLDEWQAQSNLDANTTALSRALQLLGGEQALQTNAISSLQGSLQPATVNASNLIGMRMNQNSQVANQALGLAGLEQQGNQFLGQGIAAGANGLASGIAAYNYGQNQQASAPGEPSTDEEFRRWMLAHG